MIAYWGVNYYCRDTTADNSNANSCSLGEGEGRMNERMREERKRERESYVIEWNSEHFDKSVFIHHHNNDYSKRHKN